MHLYLLLSVSIICSFLLLNRIPLYGYMSLFIHLLTKGRLSCFQCFVIMSKASRNTWLQVFV